MFSGSGNQGMVQPAKEKGVDSKQDELDNLAKKVQSILNKVTAKNFSFYVKEFQYLPIDSEAKLSLSMELIFEKVKS